jgi:hypothetical protein
VTTVRTLAWSQLRFRVGRSVALLLGIILAVTAFTVLTAASRTSQLRTVGTVTANFRPAYDILVRPRGTRTQLESATGTVQPNFLSGIYGGITLAQYHQIQQISGVQVAAPVAMVGFALLDAPVPVRLPAAEAARPGRQLYRYSTTWVSAGGRTRIPQPASFLYTTPSRLGETRTGATTEVLAGGRQVPACDGTLAPDGSPFSLAGQSAISCWSRVNGGGPGNEDTLTLTPRHPGLIVDWPFPMLIAAVDPVAEARLDGLGHAVTAGRYLNQDDGPGTVPFAGGSRVISFPVLAASGTDIGESASTQVQQLADPARPPELSLAQLRRDATAPGRTVLTTTVSADQAYQQLLAQMRNKVDPYVHTLIGAYWSAGPTRYRRAGQGRLTPLPVGNPAAVWRQGQTERYAGMDNADRQYRALVKHIPASEETDDGIFQIPAPRLVGVFDPARILPFDRLSRVPLGVYQRAAEAPADPASRQALGGADLLPTLNLGGYVSQPAQLITTLKALPVLENSIFSGDVHARDPISVIRVRVAGVTGPDPVSLERIKEVAQQIAVRTRLDVDIVAGSSPRPTVISLPMGRYGQPPLQLTEGWVKKGVAVAILTAVDKKSVVLFLLILVVCALFVANSATAAVRGRRSELGVLAGAGWTRPRLFGTVLGELASIGLTAGVLGGLASLPLSAALGLPVSAVRALLAVPAAVVLAVAAGAVPAWLAARAEPAASIQPPVRMARRGHRARTVTGLALINVLRTPGRSLIGAISLAAGTAALTLIAAITVAFRGAIVGSLLGDAVAVQVRGVDYVAVAATVVLGVLAVADVLFLNIRERSAELATMRAFGWGEPALTRLIVAEGTIIGLAGSAAGAALGLAAAAQFAGQLPGRVILAAAATAGTGTLVTIVAALLPAQLLRRLPTARLLAEE